MVVSIQKKNGSLTVKLAAVVAVKIKMCIYKYTFLFCFSILHALPVTDLPLLFFTPLPEL